MLVVRERSTSDIALETLNTLASALGCVGRRKSVGKDSSFERLEAAEQLKAAERLTFTPAASDGFVPPLVLVAFIFPALAGLNFGFDIGSTGGAVQQLRSASADLDGSSLLIGLLTSGSLFGAVVGTALSFALAAPLGRRGELLLGAALYVLGTLFTCFSPSGASQLIGVFAGRGVYGVGIAFSMHAAPVYISETSTAAVRGLLVSLKEGFIVLGILLGFSASAVATSLDLPPSLAWRVIWALPALTGSLVLLGMSAMPESPRWLVLQALPPAGGSGGGGGSSDHDGIIGHGSGEAHRRGEGHRRGKGHSHPVSLATIRQQMRAADALRRLRSPSLTSPKAADEAAVDAELRAILATLGTAAAGCTEVLSARRALLAGLGLVLLQQVTGQPSVLYYQEAIFRGAGFGELSAYASVIVGGSKLLATLFTVARVDQYGRRPLLFVGIGMMLASLAVLSVAFHEQGGGVGGVSSPGDPWAIAIVVALIVYVCGYQVGFGPIAWLIISEVFPLRTRATALSIAVMVNFAFNLLVTFSLPALQMAFDAIEPGRGMAYLFGTYALLCVVSLLFVGRYVPETKGKTLEQIEEDLRS